MKNAMLINSTVSFGLGIRNEEFIYLFFAPHLIDIWSTSANSMHYYLFSLEKKIHLEIFIWNCRGIFNVTYTVHWFRSRLSPCIMCIMTRWNFDNDHNNWKLKISCKTEMYSSGPKSTSVCVRTKAGMELWKDFKLHYQVCRVTVSWSFNNDSDNW